MKKKVWLFVPIIIGSLIFSACAAQEMASDTEMPAAMPQEELAYEEVGSGAESEEKLAYLEAGSAMDEYVEGERNYTSGVGESASEVERMVIYNANMEIAVEDPAFVMDRIAQMAEDSGGFVVSSNISHATYSNGRGFPRAYVTIRVPAGQLESIMDAIKGLTPDPSVDVVSENVSGQDVTSEYTDLSSRLRNLEAAEAALVELMEQAQDPEDVLNVFDELTYYRGEIEQVKGRMQYLEESAALSAISVDIVAKESLQPIEIAGWEPKGTAKKAVEALINSGQKLVDILIWFGIYCLPFLIPLGVVVYFIIRLFRKQKEKKANKKVELMQKAEGNAATPPEKKE